MEPLFCKNTGGYLVQVADFCSRDTSPNMPFMLVAPSPPADLDMFSWLQECPNDTVIRLHSKTELRRHVRSILNRKLKSVSLLINLESGCFAEFADFPDELCKHFAPFQLLDDHRGVSVGGIRQLRSLVICLIRHQLLESAHPLLLRQDQNTNLFKLEDGCDLFESNGSWVLRNRYSGRVFRANPAFHLPVQKLCLMGMLRQVLPDGTGVVCN